MRITESPGPARDNTADDEGVGMTQVAVIQDWLTEPEAAAALRLDIGRDTRNAVRALRRLRRVHGLPFVRIAGRVLISREKLNEWAQTRGENGEHEP